VTSPTFVLTLHPPPLLEGPLWFALSSLIEETAERASAVSSAASMTLSSESLDWAWLHLISKKYTSQIVFFLFGVFSFFGAFLFHFFLFLDSVVSLYGRCLISHEGVLLF
jgi:hypothetical protein